eukprot:11491161-Alexandrium_andersonii.AAC.1
MHDAQTTRAMQRTCPLARTTSSERAEQRIKTIEWMPKATSGYAHTQHGSAVRSLNRMAPDTPSQPVPEVPR